MKRRLILLTLCVAGSLRAGTITVVNLPPNSTDLATGITPNKTYLFTLDFGDSSSPPSNINGEPFTHIDAGNQTVNFYTNIDAHSGRRFILSSGGSAACKLAHTSNAGQGSLTNQADGNMYLLLTDLIYVGSSAPTNSWLHQEYDGLTIGHEYSLRIYYRYWGNANGDRLQNVYFNGEGAWQAYAGNPLDEDAGGASYLEYDFTAAATNVFCFMTNLIANGAAMIYGTTLEDNSVPFAPFITYEPSGVVNSIPAELSVTAIGTANLSYLWYVNTTSNYAGATRIMDGDGYSGSSTRTLTTTNLLDYFYVVVTNNYGAITSSITQLTLPLVGLSVDTQSPGPAISAGFSGLSFGTTDLQPGSNGYLFDSTDSQAITLFQQLGTKILRIGGSSVETVTPTTADVDALFRFAAATGVSVIYSLPLDVTNSSQDTPMAGYIWTNYLPMLDSFAIGNEPSGAFSNYFPQWSAIVTAITNVIPDAGFSGPDGGSELGGNEKGTDMAAVEAGSILLTAIQFHYYPGGGPGTQTVAQMISNELSPTWTSSLYPEEYSTTGSPILPYGIPYRFTEVESFDGGGLNGGDNTFATALFALDFMHWWATNGCQAICFHTTRGKYNGVFYYDAEGNYQVYPVGYGIKAFTLGGSGNVIPVQMTNLAAFNLTAYAVAKSNTLYVTIINKENGTNARTAPVTIAPAGLGAGNVSAMFLLAPNNNAGATNGITLGGASINDNGPWLGQWTSLGTLSNGQCTMTVPATSAAIVRISPLLVPTISLSSVGTNLVITYTGTLRCSSDVEGPYVPVPGASSPSYVIPENQPQMFYRASNP